MSSDFRITVTGLDQAKGYFDRSAREIDKATDVAIRVEGNRLRKLMKAEIKAGAPGGRQFAPLSVIARRFVRGREKKPLERLAIPVRYWFRKTDTGSAAHVGFTGGDVVDIQGRQNSNNQLSRSWVRLAVMHQQGYSYPIPELGRSLLRRLGGRLRRQGWEGEARFYFLRKKTTRITNPARPIIEPFWAAHKDEALANIRKNFSRKLGGERI